MVVFLLVILLEIGRARGLVGLVGCEWSRLSEQETSFDGGDELKEGSFENMSKKRDIVSLIGLQSLIALAKCLALE